METIISEFFTELLSEHGLVVALLVVALVKVWMSKEDAEKRNAELVGELLSVVKSNTESMTALSTKIDHQKEVRDAQAL
jgi:hypothetical protein